MHIHDTSITLDPALWGAHLWATIDSILIVFDPASPESVEFTLLFFHSLQGVIPCFDCRNHYCLYYRDHPLQDALVSKQRLLEWVLTLKNAIQERLGRPTTTLHQCVRRMESKFQVALTPTPVLDMVIPISATDLGQLPPFLEALDHQVILPHHVVLCLSEATEPPKLVEAFPDLPLVILSTPNKQTPSENKNRGIEYCLETTRADAVLFVHWRDTLHPQQTWRVRETLLDHPTASLIVHNQEEKVARKDTFLLVEKMCVLHSQLALHLNVCRDVRFHPHRAENDVLQRVQKQYGNVWCYSYS